MPSCSILIVVIYFFLNVQRLTVRKRDEVEKEAGELSHREILRERVAKRAAVEFQDGMYGILAKILLL